jgi:hypothetical protein
VDEITRRSTRTFRPCRPRAEGLVDQHAQDLGLGAQRHVGDLVEIDDPAMGLFQKPLLHPALGGFAAEQHLLHVVGLDRGGGHGDEGRAGAVGIGVDPARGDLLAGARPPVSITRPLDFVTFSSCDFSA